MIIGYLDPRGNNSKEILQGFGGCQGSEFEFKLPPYLWKFPSSKQQMLPLTI